MIQCMKLIPTVTLRNGNVVKEENTGITLSLSVSCPVLDKLDAIKREDYLNERRYQAAYALANEFHVCSDDEREKKEKAKLFRSESMQEQEYHIRLKRPSLY